MTEKIKEIIPIWFEDLINRAYSGNLKGKELQYLKEKYPILQEIENEGNKPYISELEWLGIFPEAREYLKKKSLLLQGKVELAETWLGIQYYLYRCIEKPSQWFYEAVIDNFLGSHRQSYIKENKRISFLIEPKIENKDRNLTDNQIERARHQEIKPLYEQYFGQVRGWLVICLFHNEKTASMNIKGNYYYCHSCGAKGDAIDFLMKVKGCSFREAILSLQ